VSVVGDLSSFIPPRLRRLRLLLLLLLGHGTHAWR
jgi:hypothetical protein